MSNELIGQPYEWHIAFQKWQKDHALKRVGEPLDFFLKTVQEQAYMRGRIDQIESKTEMEEGSV